VTFLIVSDSAVFTALAREVSSPSMGED